MQGMYDNGLGMVDTMNRNQMNMRLSNIEHEVMLHKSQNAMAMGSRSGSSPFLAPTAAQGKDPELLTEHHKLLGQYMELMKNHTDLLNLHKATLKREEENMYKPVLQHNASGTLRKSVCLGIIRLDYNYPPAPGDIDCPDSYGYDVIYRVVPGLTFDMCQSGKMTSEVADEFEDAIHYLEKRGVQGITGDCGFMMYFQLLARRHTKKPVFMSALAQLPAITCAFARDELIAIFTANSKTLTPMRSLIKDECGVDPDEKRFIIVGCQDVPGFDAVEEGGKVDTAKVTPGMVALAKATLRKHPHLRAYLLECTELPPYADAIRNATGLPVYDAITGCDFFMCGLQDNKRFGLNDWQEGWDKQQDDYKFGSNLNVKQRSMLVNK